MSRFKTIGRKLDLEFGDNINENFSTSDAELTRIEVKVDTNSGDINSRATQIEQDSITRDTTIENTIATKESESIERDDNLDTRIDNIVAQAGTDNTEIVDGRLGADDVSRPVIGDLLREIHAEQLQANKQVQPISHGVHVLNATQSSDLKVEFHGQTRVNEIIPRIGKIEDLNDFNTHYTSIALDTSNKVYGSNSLKITNTADGQQNASTKVKFDFKAGKYYLVAVELKNGNANDIRMSINGSNSNRISDATKFNLVYLKINPSSDLSKEVLFIVDGLANQYGYVDGLRKFEITSEQYNKIGVEWTTENGEIQKRFNYTEGISFVKNPVLSAEGEQLLEYLEVGSISSNGSDYTTTETVRSNYIRLLGNQQITIKNHTYSDDSIRLFYYDENKNLIGSYVDFIGEYSFTTPSNCNYIRFRSAYNDMNQKIMVNLGTTSKPYTDYNPSYLYAQTTLAGIEGGKKDILSHNEDKRRWEKTKWFESDVAINSVITKNTTLTTNVDLFLIFEYSYSETYLEYNVLTNSNGDLLEQIPSSERDNVENIGKYYVNNSGSIGNVWLVVAKGTDETTFFSNENYFLLYQLASPVTEWEGEHFPLVEGDVVVNGLTQVEVSVEGNFMEEVLPSYDSGSKRYHLGIYGHSTITDSNTKKRIDKILKIYKNGNEDTKWVIEVTPNYVYGNARASIPEVDFDTTATYTVTYIAVNEGQSANLTEVKASYDSSIKSAFDSQVTKVSDIATGLSVVERQVILLDARLDAGGL